MDPTMLSTFKACPAKSHMRFNLNKTTPLKPRPLDRGTIIHLGYEDYWKTLKKGLPWEAAVQSGLLGIRVGLTESDLSGEDGNRCLEVFEEVAHRWKIEDLSFEIVEVEQVFSFVLYEDENFRFVMMGKIDLIVNDHRYTNLPIDHKSYERDFPLSRLKDQFICYAYVTQSNYLYVNRVGFQTSIKPEIKHKRVPLSYDHIFFEQWKKDTIRWFFMYYDCAVENYWPLNDTSCEKFNRQCEYIGICETTGEENKAHKLNVDFKTDTPWDVGKALAMKE